MNVSTESENDDDDDKKESFEFSFLKLRLKATGSQEEIRKTVITTWWLPISALLVLALMVILGASELLEKLALLILKK